MTTLAIARLRATREIDAAAGEARLRHITDVPGQQAVYIVKREQAAQYLAEFALDENAVAPPYIAQEAAALEVTAEVLALQVMEIAALWEDTLSPAIEAARIGGKAAVMAAVDVEAVEVARDLVLAELAAI